MDNWICAKCGNNSFERSKIHTTGGYTELYREDVSAGMNILDFLFGK